ncbi:MAG: sigma-70 family RNA polymerase sigma factor [Geodermatophilaceae bacterium]
MPPPSPLRGGAAYGKVGLVQAERAAEIFAEQRGYLLGVSYRLTSSWADAEDLVAEAWPRWAEHADEVVDPRAWLTRVVGRLSLDHLRSARVRRETYVGPWLPEPLVTAAPVMVGGAGGFGSSGVGGGGGSAGGSGVGSADTDVGGASGPGADPLEILVRDESVRMAFLVLLDELSPEQRLAVVLHDVLAIDFTDIADVLGCSVSNARQHASRGRRRLSKADPAPRQAAELAWSVLDEMSTALFAGDIDRLTRLLAPDVVLMSDGAGKVTAARRPVVGAAKVAGFLAGLVTRYGQGASVEPVLVNGDPGFLVRVDSAKLPVGRPGTSGKRAGAGAGIAPVSAYTFCLRGRQIVAMYGVLAPDKLTRLR